MCSFPHALAKHMAGMPGVKALSSGTSILAKLAKNLEIPIKGAIFVVKFLVVSKSGNLF